MSAGISENRKTESSGGLCRRSLIVAAAGERLRRSGYSAVRDLACEVRDGWLILRGILPSFYLKQVALAAVVDIADVRGVADHVRVANRSCRDD